ncbi:diphthine--ammonia ligase [Psychrobacillus lasiicapitis]|uniref:Diphthine--ammonia ligase n=1 Tax=Psychrobacillus lasiicapitis TaxID=1636719 RepID=A0A544T6Z1_9BACI|nr:diphthine--ammonia ligase [Psychrobacillus lasiicapitis]TQR13168.1 diphthine--ammonia ligase [Psychrobacillus lasiicapitis]GGA33911.1 ATPase [Psychrobacillus lasiicapitis]
MQNASFVASWSGGKDSALAYYRAVQLGMTPKKVLTMFEEDGEISKSHALPLEVVQAQVERLGVPLLTKAASWGTYEHQFTNAMDACREEGITHGVFGDIDLEGHLEWVQKTCAKSDIVAVHPLWQMTRKSVVDELLAEGFEAWIIVVNKKMMPAKYVGEKLTREIVEELELAGIDACGENGEFHTVIVDGPIFSSRVPVIIGEPVHRGDYVLSPVSLEE